MRQWLGVVLIAAGLGLSTGQLARAQSPSDTGRTLSIEVTGLNADKKGQVCVRLYEAAANFPTGDEGVTHQDCHPVTADRDRFEFTDVGCQTCAIALLHDTNGNRKMDTNFFGIPKEGFGFSNNPIVSRKTRAPDFQRASFPFPGSSMQVTIGVKYGLDR
ncbi:DUF2141 domain-containing protein [Roseofilum casamattae]|uniref:DUF2141 domain-containing protein n=1 Tax=Roseofilum casamattae BLCC-M143 TaxID=3022442 RepID=A0ABT7C1Y4_9CYAN|nr:DUF2141 domain-containing protein [Roseofilum casamattae]MDJ1184538.1 DUF2141 domain-containing protein [Roseofilum casamattae BLCC-M143]